MTDLVNSVKCESHAVTIAVCVNRSHVGKMSPNSLAWDVYNRSFKPETMDAYGLASAINGGFSVAPVFHTARHGDNFMSAQHIGLDFDDSDFTQARSDDYVDRYAAILHTTTNHSVTDPRCRAIFLLDKPIYDSAMYSNYARALVWHSQLADNQCTDVARAWFGAKGCQLEIDATKVLPLSVLDAIWEEYKESHQTTVEFEGFRDGDPSALLDKALRDAKAGNRHGVGFQLYCGLRDIGLILDDAKEYAQIYQQTVEKLSNHPYLWAEAWASLRGAYSRKPRRFLTTEITQALAAFECAIWASKDLPKSSRHYILKTAMGISQIAERTKKISNLYLSTRSFSNFGISNKSASTHLKKLVDLGFLTLEKKADKRQPARYSINLSKVDPVAQPGQSTQVVQADITASPMYKRLQPMPHFEYGAKIDPNMVKTNLTDGTLGPTALRIIAVLGTSQDKEIGAKVTHTEEKSNIFFLVCEGFAPILSMTELWVLAGISKRSGRDSFKTLVDLGVCQYEYAPDNNKTRLPSLTENWYERLLEIEPMLTTFGKKEKRNHHNNQQSALHHANLSNYGAKEDRERSLDRSINAYKRLADSQSALDEVKEKRKRQRAKVTGD